MKKLIAATFLLPILAAAQIGTPQTSGDLTVLPVQTADELSVYVQSRSCSSTGVEISVVFANAEPGARRIETKSQTWTGCGTALPVRISFASNGKLAQEIRVTELGRLLAHMIRP